MIRIWTLSALFLFVPSFLPPAAGTALACTLFGAAGSAVEGGGVLVGKNRDLPLEEEQIVVRRTPRVGPAFMGIASRKSGRITAGVNDKGLVIVTASAGSVADRTRKHLRLEEILERVTSVEGALRVLRQAGMISPIHYLLADPGRLAVLEVFDGEHHAVREIADGVLTHTNHYLLPSMSSFNGKIGRSSRLRLERIRKLMSRPPFSPETFMAFSRDHGSGPGGDSLCRHPLPGKKTANVTVSAWVVRIDPRHPPDIRVRLGRPCGGSFVKISF
jgi:isopenicillin-N N-acyltransferase like protein